MAGQQSTHSWLQEMNKNCEAPLGKYIRQIMLMALAERMGHDIPELPLPNPDDRMVANVIMDGVEEDDSEGSRYRPIYLASRCQSPNPRQNGGRLFKKVHG